jgi:hypothetical protein
MKKVIMLCMLSFLMACAGKDEAEVPPTIADSIVKPQSPVATGEGIEIDSSSGVLIDHSRMRTPEHTQTLERFKPVDVASIYHDFLPLRKEQLKQSTLDSFLAAKKITLKELHAILSEGDQLGWNTAPARPTPAR